MKKIILTESQTKKLMKKVINERYLDDERNHMTVNCDFGYHGVTYKGGEIDDIGKIAFDVSYEIDMEWRSYGIKGISVGQFQGPKYVELEITYFPAGTNPNDDSIEEIITLPLDWTNLVNTNNNEELGYFGMDDDLDIILANDQQGNIIVKSIEVNMRGF